MEAPPRQPYPSAVSDDEWAFVAPYLTLMKEDAPQRDHRLRDLRMLLRELVDHAPQPTAAVLDSRTLQSSPESGARAGYDGAKRRKGSKVYAAVDTLGHLLPPSRRPLTRPSRWPSPIRATPVRCQPQRQPPAASGWRS
jgi:hypothetical protein